MNKRYVAIWFPHLGCDALAIHQQVLKGQPYALVSQERNKQWIINVSYEAQQLGLRPNMPLADARISLPSLQAFSYQTQAVEECLMALAHWCIRFTPYVALVPPDGLLLEVAGCTHLWKNEATYLQAISKRLAEHYQLKIAIADTIGAAWAMVHYGNQQIIAPKQQLAALLPLPPQALRLDVAIVERLAKLGFHHIESFIRIAPNTLRRRFGDEINLRIGQALGYQHETFVAIEEPHPYQERLPCLEPIQTANGIAIAVEKLLEKLCTQLQKKDLGLRSAVLKTYRLDGKLQQISIGTNQPSIHIKHLFKLFELKINQLEPDLGIELFVMEASKVERLPQQQEALWQVAQQTKLTEISELLDRISIKAGKNAVRRYLPQANHWPEHSIKAVSDVTQQAEIAWPLHKPRPTVLLNQPEPIQVSAPIPDYPPMNFSYKGEVHRIVKADGPERIEREWWLTEGLHRDYYGVEDEKGQRYWIFRLGHYHSNKAAQWFIHGYFA
ncbi:Y-family DNA polymerase [Pedobacter sp. SL55]|uniref:Y-family DNA polymerase n=1 Tax=Pedobacter sp. SL55 TaxID=2995161 RepID=UPI0022702B0A|nr:DNA polymerase Y family protein [Pedobacter sp. SL55]WAC42531.1 DNA polymerase Y family protein [Pedobacter sp. SL55]